MLLSQLIGLLGCFIFSSFLKSKMLGSAYDGILATDSKYVIFFHMTSF